MCGLRQVLFSFSFVLLESSRLACFPWPKEQFVALDEIFGWAMDNSDLLDKACKVIQELHCKYLVFHRIILVKMFYQN